MFTAEVEKLLIRFETDIITAQKNGDFSFVENLLWDEFQEIDSRGGISDKVQIIEAIRAARLYDHRLEDFSVNTVSDTCAIVTYIATTKRRFDGQERILRARRSSTWVKRDGFWKMIFHQGTPVISV
jgi:glyoxylase I family protein